MGNKHGRGSEAPESEKSSNTIVPPRSQSMHVQKSESFRPKADEPELPKKDNELDSTIRKASSLRKEPNRKETNIKVQRQNTIAVPDPSSASRKLSACPTKSDEKMLEISSIQRAMVTKMWNLVRHRGTNEPGITIFHYSCIKGSHLRPIFCCSHQNGSIVRDDAEGNFSQKIKMHASSFVEVMDKMLGSPDKTGEVNKQLRQMGAQHAVLKDIGFKTQYFDVFASAMIDCSFEWGDRAKRNPEIQKAWTEIVMHVVREMKDGFYDELKRVRRQSVRKKSTAEPRSRLTTTTDDDYIGASTSARASMQPDFLNNTLQL